MRNFRLNLARIGLRGDCLFLIAPSSSRSRDGIPGDTYLYQSVEVMVARAGNEALRGRILGLLEMPPSRSLQMGWDFL